MKITFQWIFAAKYCPISPFFFSLNKLEILFLFFTLQSAEQSQKNRKTKSKQQIYWHSLPRFAVGYFSQHSSLLPIHWYWKGRGVSSGLASRIVSPKIDVQQKYQKWICKTTTQVEGYNLLLTTLSQYIDSAVTWKLILTLCRRKPLKCLKSRRCINEIQR